MNKQRNLFKGIGTDIIEIFRIKQAIERHGFKFLNRIFTIQEQNYCRSFSNPYPYFAARFAAKEAALKALGTGLSEGFKWLDIEIVKDYLGKPTILISPQIKAKFSYINFFISISHCNSYATATVILTS